MSLHSGQWQVLDIRLYTNPFFFPVTYFSGTSTYSDLAAPTSTTSPEGYALSTVFVWVATITMGTSHLLNGVRKWVGSWTLDWPTCSRAQLLRVKRKRGFLPFRFTLGGGKGAATRRPTLDGLSLMHRGIFLIIMCATLRTKLGPIGLATTIGMNNFLGKTRIWLELCSLWQLSASLACGGPSGVIYKVSLSVFSEV